MSDETTIFSQYPIASWTVGGKTLTFDAQKWEESGGNRIVGHKRVFRDGERQDDTGSEAKKWTATVLFSNQVELQNGGLDAAQYPDNCNAMIASFDVHETGDLVVPTRGLVRCRAQTYQRVESRDSGLDAAACVFVWVQDNEDDSSQAAFTAPSAASVLSGMGSDVMASAEAAGALSDDLSSIGEMASQLESLANAPGEYMSDVEAQAAALQGAVQGVEESFCKTAASGAAEVYTLLTDPGASRAGKLLRSASDTAAKMTIEKAGVSVARVVTKTWSRTMSIFDVSADTGQDIESLMQLNVSLPDLLAIPAGTGVRVYASTASA